MAGGPLSELAVWFDRRAAGAPSGLREHAAGFVEERTPAGGSGDPAPVLAAAAMRALGKALDRGAGRSGALDLLAADALLTLALLAKAERDPAALPAFAEELRRAAVAVR